MRELTGFIAFQADLIDILDQLEERFGKASTADKLQQEFYLQADLIDILDQLEERFGKASTADKLQQEFYLLAQE